MRIARLFLLAAVVCAVAVVAFGRAADGHGVLDQALLSDPGCTQNALKATGSSAASLRQEFVPTQPGLTGVDLCLTIPGTSTVFVNIRSGTAAAPGSVLSSVNSPQLPTGPPSDARWVHIELPSTLATTPGTPLVIEVTGTPQFFWRGTCGAVGGACLVVEPDQYPSGVSNAGPAIGDFAFRSYGPQDLDNDGILDGQDNCPFNANPGQENADGNFIELGGFGKLYDDLTWPNSDVEGDACDADDDNDGLADSQELSWPGGACPPATAPTSPTLRDSDGDRYLDGAECALGSNPNSAASVPVLPNGADTDGDKLSNAIESAIGSNPNIADTDGDGIRDNIEYLYYNSSPSFAQTDLDVCNDAKEIMSINGDQTVNVTDLQQAAGHIGAAGSAGYIVHFDVDKSGAINIVDLFLQATKTGGCL